jgi:predicted TIM-barrel fold metal-dependent hydrolase
VAPAGVAVFDSHLHIIDPRFPLVANRGYLPPPFTVDDYRERTAALGIAGGAVVSGSFQAFDQTYLVDALQRLGPGFVGVTQLPPTVTDEEILALDRAGVRALRCNLHRSDGELDDALARRVHELAGWHAEVYVDGRELAGIEDRLRALPRVSIDHLGLHAAGLPALLRLVRHGVKVKATGFGRVDLDVPSVLRTIASVEPTALLFGTDLPGTRARRAFAPADLDLVGEIAPAALAANALAWYRPALATSRRSSPS